MKKLDVPSKVILFCDGSKCSKQNKNNRKIVKTLVKAANIKNEVTILKTHCTDNCKCSPVVSFQPNNIWFGDVSENKIVALFDEYVLKP